MIDTDKMRADWGMRAIVYPIDGHTPPHNGAAMTPRLAVVDALCDELDRLRDRAEKAQTQLQQWQIATQAVLEPEEAERIFELVNEPEAPSDE